MGLFNLKKELIKKGIPEDINRYLKREIEIAKTNLPGINYRFAHHLLVKYESVMDIWVASESSASEIEALKKDHAFCLKAVEDENNLLWICPDCREIIGVFKNTIHEVTEQSFAKYLTGMIDNCPSCGVSSNSLMKSGFLLSGLTLEQTMPSMPPIVEDTKVKDKNIEQSIWIIFRETYPDLKECNKQMIAIYGGINPIINMIKEGQEENLLIRCGYDGNYWNIFGKLTPDDIKRFGLSEKVEVDESQRKIDKTILPKILGHYLKSRGHVNGISAVSDLMVQHEILFIKGDLCEQHSVDINSNDGKFYVNNSFDNNEVQNALFWLTFEEMEIPWNLRAGLLNDQCSFRFLNKDKKMRWINGNFEEIGRV